MGPPPEICLKPKEDSCTQFFLHQHMFTNPIFKRPVDPVSHFSRNMITVFGKTLELLFSCLIAYGVVNTGDSVNFSEFFTDPPRIIVAAILASLVPIVVFVFTFIMEAVLENAENTERPPILRPVLYALFWSVEFATILAIFIVLFFGGLSTVQVGFTVWVFALLLSACVYSPIIITIFYCVRSKLGKDRGDDKESLWCPPPFAPYNAVALVAAFCLMGAMAFSIVGIASTDLGYLSYKQNTTLTWYMSGKNNLTDRFSLVKVQIGWESGSYSCEFGSTKKPDNTTTISGSFGFDDNIAALNQKLGKNCGQVKVDSNLKPAGHAVLACCCIGLFFATITFGIGVASGFLPGKMLKIVAAFLGVITMLALVLGWAIYVGYTADFMNSNDFDNDYAFEMVVLGSGCALVGIILFIVSFVTHKDEAD